jgi:aryl-alcohol dehydrogenase-like predicted oxidoreductase
MPLGNTDVEVSVFCLGAMRFGWHTPREISYQLLDMYIEAGGSFVDTANIYGRKGNDRVGCISEELLGDWIRERSNRSEIFVASKVGFHYEGVERGLRASQITTECEKSLRRLGTDRIDLYYAHVDDRHTPLEETMEAFDRLVRAGKVRCIGASNFLAWRLESARWVSHTHGWAEYCCVQQRHSFLRPRPGASFGNQIAANTDLLDYCRSQGITLLAYSPLLSGAYTRSDRAFGEQYRGPDSNARLATLNAVAAEIDATPNQVVLAWMRQSDPPVIPLIAASKPAQMRENLAAAEVELSAEHLARLTDASA